MDNNTEKEIAPVPEQPPAQEPPEQKKQRKRLPAIYWGYLMLLAVTLTLFSFYALKADDTTFSFELKKMELPSYALAAASGREAVPDSAAPAEAVAESAAEHVEQVWADTAAVIKEKHYNYPFADEPDDDSCSVRFLLIGDSMNEFLRIRLNDYCIANGYKMHCVIWYGSSTKQYGTCDTLAHFIRKFKPTYVLLTIGANELFIRDIIKHRTPYVQHIINQIGNIPFVWVGPPNWKNDTGINELILSHVGSSRYFESKKLSFKRCSDGAHPTKSSAFNWMDEIASYLSTSALHPVVMNHPDTTYNKIPHTTILKMVR